MKFLLAFLFILVLCLFNVQAAPIEKRSPLPGDGTYYDVGLGSCGDTNSDSEMVAALSSSVMEGGSYCGKSVTVKSSGKSVTVKAVDTCPSCGEDDVDLSPAAFKKLAPLNKGRIDVTWS
ncbi:RlpA-like double-psi beta-barrel-protein domain-containing protein-containing protein [Sporodiniella umbellata]|nr:RlpA-like double-psi beta-barrel-protein domain-containing protein-containing protein [Sporodiniella umbellata]